VFSENHFFLLPTAGENFGHVILEALTSGCPVLISDQTPWRALQEEGIGWDLSLNDQNIWLEALNTCVRMDNVEYQKMRKRTLEYAHRWNSQPEALQSNIELFEKAAQLQS
jgi:glycosyltransferase involved in cell wall biosynthesis